MCDSQLLWFHDLAQNTNECSLWYPLCAILSLKQPSMFQSTISLSKSFSRQLCIWYHTSSSSSIPSAALSAILLLLVGLSSSSSLSSVEHKMRKMEYMSLKNSPFSSLRHVFTFYGSWNSTFSTWIKQVDTRRYQKYFNFPIRGVLTTKQNKNRHTNKPWQNQNKAVF